MSCQVSHGASHGVWFYGPSCFVTFSSAHKIYRYTTCKLLDDDATGSMVLHSNPMAICNQLIRN